MEVHYDYGLIKTDALEWVERQHFREWNLYGAENSKALIGPLMNKKRLSEAMDLPRKDLRILVGALTGHLGTLIEKI